MKIRTILTTVAVGFTATMGLPACNKKKTEPAQGAEAVSAPAAVAASAATVPQPKPQKAEVNGIAHLPPTCHLVVHVAIARALATEVVKKHLLPQLEAMKKAPADNPHRKSFGEFLDAIDMDPLKDLGSISVCMGAEPSPGEVQSMVTILGGSFAKAKIVEAFRKYSPKKDTFKDVTFEGDVHGIVADKLYSVQAQDGTPIFGTDQKLIVAALVAGEAYKGYELPQAVDMSMVVTKAAIDAMAKNPQSAGPFGQLLQGSNRAVFSVSLVDHRITLDAFHPSKQKALGASKGLDIALKQMARQAQMAASINPQAAMVADVASRAKVSAVDNALHIVLDIPEEALGAFLQQLGPGILQQLTGMGPAGPAGMPPGAMPQGMPPGAMPQGMPPGAMPRGMPRNIARPAAPPPSPATK